MSQLRTREANSARPTSPPRSAPRRSMVRIDGVDSSLGRSKPWCRKPRRLGHAPQGVADRLPGDSRTPDWPRARFGHGCPGAPKRQQPLVLELLFASSASLPFFDVASFSVSTTASARSFGSPAFVASSHAKIGQENGAVRKSACMFPKRGAFRRLFAPGARQTIRRELLTRPNFLWRSERTGFRAFVWSSMRIDAGSAFVRASSICQKKQRGVRFRPRARDVV